jgi:methionyl-tRNA formyltransferase
MRFAFFGTPLIARIVLEELEAAGYVPALVVTNPDAPVGRKQILTPPPVKEWALERSVPVIQPQSLKDPAAVPELGDGNFDLFIVAAYGKLIPQRLLDIPRHGTLNVHPSLLPKFRGASPIRSAILADERETGVTIMLMDAGMDHGPILTQEKTNISEPEWPVPGRILDERLARQGGRLLSTTIPRYLTGDITPREQNHEAATFCTKIAKEMGELTLDPHHLPTGNTAQEYLRKVCAFDGWPETFFMHGGKRVKIKDAQLVDGVFTPTRVVPEGKTEMSFTTWLTIVQR